MRLRLSSVASSYDCLMLISAGMALGLRTLYILGPCPLVGRGKRARLCGMSRGRGFWEEDDDAMISRDDEEEMKLKQLESETLSAYQIVL